jgi:hypothetical protein
MLRTFTRFYKLLHVTKDQAWRYRHRGDRLMAAISGSTHYQPNVPIHNHQGTWIAIAAGTEEAVRVFIPGRSGNVPQANFLLWWNGSATPRAVREWVAERMKNPALECRIKILADQAPIERSYRVDDVGRIADDIQRWANDGAVACSIGEAPQNRELVYMWAELKESDAEIHPGEVGLQYAANALETNEGKLVFSILLHKTALRKFSEDEIELVYVMLRENVRKYADMPPQASRHA